MNQNQLREYLFQQDLAHEKQMDRLIKDAQPKKINEDYKIKLMRPPIITRLNWSRINGRKTIIRFIIRSSNAKHNQISDVRS